MTALTLPLSLRKWGNVLFKNEKFLIFLLRKKIIIRMCVFVVVHSIALCDDN